MPSGGVARHPPANAAPSNAQVECQPGQASFWTPTQFGSPAEGTGLATDLDVPVGPKVLLPLPAVLPRLTLPDRFVRADEYPFSLVVEVGTKVDESKVIDSVDTLISSAH